MLGDEFVGLLDDHDAAGTEERDGRKFGANDRPVGLVTGVGRDRKCRVGILEQFWLQGCAGSPPQKILVAEQDINLLNLRGRQSLDELLSIHVLFPCWRCGLTIRPFQTGFAATNWSTSARGAPMSTT